MSIRRLAKHLGLSVTTVSRALAGYPDVAAATRERVQQEAARTGYRFRRELKCDSDGCPAESLLGWRCSGDSARETLKPLKTSRGYPR